MTTKLPLKNLVKLSWWFSLCIGLIVLVFVFIDQENIVLAIVGGIINAGCFFIIFIAGSYINIGFLLVLERMPQHQQLCWKLLRITGAILLVMIVNRAIHSGDKLLIAHHWLKEEKVLKLQGNVLFLYLAIKNIMQSLVVNLVIIVWHNYILAQVAIRKAEMENARLKVMHAEAANQLLRQQIHPHFLFNALNILKSLIRAFPDMAEEYLIHLSNFLRASVSSNHNPVASLRDEIKLSRDYLEMQNIRFGKALHYSIDVSESALLNGFVLSFSLLPLLENAIKHNEVTAQHPLHIHISQEEDRIKVTNNVRLRQHKEVNTGVGLTNLSERYQLWSGDDVIIKEGNSLFSVSIKIVDHANSNPGR